MIPAIAYDKANEGLPKQIDPITTLEHVEIKGRDVHYFYRLSETVPLTSGEVMKAGLGPNACTYWKPKFQSGEFTSAVYNYSFKDGNSSFVLDQFVCK